MNPQNAEYFRQLIAHNSPRSNLISTSIAKIDQQQLSAFIDQTHTNSAMKKRARTQTKQSKHNKYHNATTASNKQQIEIDPPCSVRQLGDQQQKLIHKYQNQLVDLRIAKQLHELSLQDSSNSLHKLKAQKRIAACVRKEREIFKCIEELNRAKEQKIAEQQQLVDQARQKKELIIQRLKKLQEYKNKRQEILSAKSLPVIPKYKLMEKKFAIQEIENELDKNVKSRRLKQLRYKNYLGLGSLDQSRIERLNTEVSKVKKNLKTGENMHLLSKQQLLERKSQFVQLLQQKRKRKVVHIDRARELQIAILKDKEKNPLKYNFLKLKNLTEEQIFRDFKDYELDFDRKQLGKQYLQQSKMSTKHKQKSQLKTESHQQPSPQDKQPSLTKIGNRQQNLSNDQGLCEGKDDSKLFNYKEQIYKVLRNSESKSKVLQLLSQESSKKHKNMVHLREELQKSKQYHDFIKIEKNIDKDYLEFLKTKIVSLRLQTEH